MATILVIEDDVSIRQTLVAILERANHKTAVADSLATARQQFEHVNPDLIVLDIGLPDGTGYALAAQWRAVSNVGIVILTGRGEIEDRVLGLSLGADYYLVKPVDPREFVATIQTLLTRIQGQRHAFAKGQEHTQSGWRLDGVTWRLLSDSGVNVALTGKEYLLLKTLSEAKGQHVSRQALTERLGGVQSLNAEKAMNVLISRLRKKVADQSDVDLPLKTLRSHGYAFPGLYVEA